MILSRRLIATSVVAAVAAFPGVASAARATSSSHHKHAHVCKKSHRKHKHRARCAAHKSVPKHTTKGFTPTHVVSVLAAASSSVTPAPAVSAPNTSGDVNLQQLLETPCQNTGLTPTPSNLTVISEATLCLINQERARHGEQPLRTNGHLQQSAEGHDQDMIARDYFSHYTPTGEGPAERAQAAGYMPNAEVGWSIGENIAWGTDEFATPQATVTAWINSPEHLENILNSKYQDSGIGVEPAVPASYGKGEPGAIYTQDFGVID